ncbi:dihydrodipicolinate synthase family protein [Kribbella sp. NBC_01245]|uniref:dihydrodipicolinate synthase family protein n=1 Tax=Kribbella sp. NBC_01245 TaxID=2903578 RepID=UPI002E29A902|nr:dihydrodipicolinate synthase family protein [Kribbella sp. NBC_01245]
MTLTGLYVPLITPFDSNGGVALDPLESLAHQMLDAGATGLVCLGTTAEPAALSDSEKRAVFDVLAGVCRTRDAQLVVGADRPSELEALADWPEVVAAQVPVPSFVRPGDAGVLAYFTHLASVSPVPLVIYHIPYRTGQSLTLETLRRLASLPGVAAFKYAAGGIDNDTVALMSELPDDFAVLGGDDVVISPLLALGAHGAILASAHVDTADFVSLIDLWHAGDVPRARALGHRLAALSSALFAEPNPTVVKAVLHARGLIPTADVRLPLVSADPQSLEYFEGLNEGVANVSRSEVPSMR